MANPRSRWNATPTSRASSRCSPRGARRGRSRRTGATSPRCARSSASPSSSATTEQLERYTAQLRADGLSAATIARRTAAARSFFRHQQLLGAREDNPAAAVQLPRRTRTLPKTLSPGEAERLIDAATGTQPRALRDQALVELLYGAGLRVSEAIGLEKAGVDLDDRLVRVIGKGSKERVVPSAGRPPRPCGATSRAAGRTSTAATGPSSS